MRKVTLVYLPNSNYLLGTFNTGEDLAASEWWISSGFDGVESVEKGLQLYGEIHVAICKKIDGTYSIYQSKDCAQSWTEVLNLPGKIYDIIKIAPGWAICNTYNGFYETTIAGTTWSLVLGLPAAPAASAICNVGGADVLLCTDGRYIWRSTNIARSWTRVCDQSTIPYRGSNWSASGTNLWPDFSWLGSPLHAAIAGANGEVLCAFGPFMTWSGNGGVSWDRMDLWDRYVTGWESASEVGGLVYPPKSIIYDRHPKNGTDAPNFVVKQILVSKVDGAAATDCMYVVRVDDLNPAPGESKLYARIFYGHHGRINSATYGWIDDIGPSYHHVFQQYVSPDDAKNQLAVYELPVTGETYTDRVTISAQTRTVDGKAVPSLKCSSDGGRTWTTIDISQFTYSGGFDTATGPFLDNNFSKTVWTWGACENYGSWSFTTGKATHALSYDMGVSFDSGEEHSEDYSMIGKIEGDTPRAYRMTGRITANHADDYSLAGLLGEDKTATYSATALIRAITRATYRMHWHRKDYPTASYTMSGVILKSQFPTIIFPQAFNLEFPWFAEQNFPYSSSTED